MKSLQEYILEANSVNSDAFCEELISLIRDKKYDEIIEKLAKAKADKNFPNITLANIKTKLNNFDTLFGVNEKKKAFVIAVYFPKTRGIYGYLFKDGKITDIGHDWVCPSWSMLWSKLGVIEEDNKFKFKYFYSTEPNKEFRMELIGGLAEFEKY